MSRHVFHLHEKLHKQLSGTCPFAWLKGRNRTREYCKATTILNTQLPTGCFQNYLRIKGIILNMVGNDKKAVRILHRLLAQGPRGKCY